MSDPRPFHRIFGLAWFDFFQGTPVIVTPEVDLSMKQQFLDLAFTRPGNDPIPRPLPDGIEDLGAHSTETSTLLYDLFKAYSEDPDMANPLHEYVHQRLEELLQELPPKERIKGLSVDELLAALSPEAREELKRKLQANGTSPKSS
jgi:hypothetical protein